MLRFSPVLRAVPATLAAGIALAVGVGGVGAAYAESPTAGPTETACASCQPATGPEVDKKPEPKPTQTQEPSVPAQPEVPAPAPPAQQVPAEPEPEPTLVPEPAPPPAPQSSVTVEETAAPEATTASPSPTPSTVGPSAESNWNKPIKKSAKPTHAAAVSEGDGPGFDTGLLPITAGVLLIGLGGISFAWWSRSRTSAH